MKNIFFTVLLFGIIFSACNPNEELYEKLDEAEGDYQTDLVYELTESDYAQIASTAMVESQNAQDSTEAQFISNNNAFALNISVSDYAGVLLDDKFIAPGQGSSCELKYNYAINELDSITEYELGDDDYTAIGGDVADSLAFSYEEEPGDYLSDFLALSDTTENYIQYITCEYIHEDTLYSRSDTSICFEFVEGQWEEANIYILTAEDYDSMGAPGYFNNFSSDVEQEDYLPTFLENKYPYAQKGASYHIAFKYYDGETNVKFTAYQYDGSNWVMNRQKSDPFVNNGEHWLFDPTVHITLAAADYEVLVDYIINDPELNVYLDAEYENSEYYYGASSHFVNFDMRVSKRQDNDPLGFLDGLSDDEVLQVMKDRIPEGINIILEAVYPNAQPVSNGVDVFYAVHYATYEPDDYYYVALFQCTDVGTFEYIETNPDE
ncbi:MAG: hypothetical protein U9N85_14275 [Bacteroidota bacterium]|nr:hypothetical protein [Bacteroidota bacterium]